MSNMQDSARPKCSESEKMNNVDNPLSPDQLKILCKNGLHCISQLEVSGTCHHRVYTRDVGLPELVWQQGYGNIV